MIILGCFGGTIIFGNPHIFTTGYMKTMEKMHTFAIFDFDVFEQNFKKVSGCKAVPKSKVTDSQA